MAAPARNKQSRRSRTHQDGTRSQDFAADITAAAARLFSTKGYAATTMSDIARAVGINQSSLYYWFSSKGDVLDAVVLMSNDSADFAGPERTRYSEAAYLYALSFRDTLSLCAIPVDYFELESAAQSVVQARNAKAKDQASEALADHFPSYERLIDAVHQSIVSGIEKGEFTSDDPWMSTLSILTFSEGMQHRYHQAMQGYDPFKDAGDAPRSAQAYAHAAAQNCLATLFVSKEDIEKARTQAQEAGWLAPGNN